MQYQPLQGVYGRSGCISWVPPLIGLKMSGSFGKGVIMLSGWQGGSAVWVATWWCCQGGGAVRVERRWCCQGGKAVMLSGWHGGGAFLLLASFRKIIRNISDLCWIKPFFSINQVDSGRAVAVGWNYCEMHQFYVDDNQFVVTDNNEFIINLLKNVSDVFCQPACFLVTFSPLGDLCHLLIVELRH